MVADILRTLDTKMVSKATDSVAVDISTRGFAVGSFCPGDATNYQFIIVRPQTISGNGIMWSAPGEPVYQFGVSGRWVKMTVEPGQFVHGLHNFDHYHTRTVAELFVSLVHVKTLHLDQVDAPELPMAEMWDLGFG